MAYTTPVTDRTISDIINKNSKGYFNVSDWTRVYNNSDFVNDQFDSEVYTLDFDIITVPDIDDPPQNILALLNTTLKNIERMRYWIATYLPGEIADSGFVEIDWAWEAGDAKTAPDYENVNSWELALKLMHDYFDAEILAPADTGNLQLFSGEDLDLFTIDSDTIGWYLELLG